MQPELARTILIAIAATGGLTWLIALRFLTNSFRVKGPQWPEGMDRLDPATPRTGGVVEGRALVEGRPSELSARATTILAKERTGPLGCVKILERSNDRIVFEGVRTLTGRQTVCRVGRGELRFTSSSGAQTEIRYHVEFGTRPLVAAPGDALPGTRRCRTARRFLGAEHFCREPSGCSSPWPSVSDASGPPLPLAAVPPRRPLSVRAILGSRTARHADSQSAVLRAMTVQLTAAVQSRPNHLTEAGILPRRRHGGTVAEDGEAVLTWERM